MRRALVLSIVAFLLGGVGEGQGQDRMLTVPGASPPDTTAWGDSARPSAALDSARWWILEETRGVATSSRRSNPIVSGDREQTHAPLLVRQFGRGNVVMGRSPGLPSISAGQARIVQVGRRNAVLPVRMPWGLRVSEDVRDRPLGGVAGARNRLLVVQGTRSAPARANRVGRVAQIGWFHRADVRQMGATQRVGWVVQRGETGRRLGVANTVVVRQRGQENVVRRVVQSGSLNRIQAQQRGALNTLSLKQVGVDSTARVQQDGVGNVAQITQRSIGV